MIALDEDALVCDLAETYHVHNMYDFPALYVAILASGLRENSRIKLKMIGAEHDLNTLLLAHIADNTAINVWFKTEDGQKGVNRPASLVNIIAKIDNSEYMTFESGEDFFKEWRRING